MSLSLDRERLPAIHSPAPPPAPLALLHTLAAVLPHTTALWAPRCARRPSYYQLPHRMHKE
ncbi:hypothetical protein E2C01_016913 [Portunus trituberculatus]|uniref:Uncharacterized protein n=1 Tax=Portunus trituberculatus TaxID=210409 RepID=A0A5B7DSE6_PORTR|nr:hypothetical protein [Portunus trituberculatus]